MPEKKKTDIAETSDQHIRYPQHLLWILILVIAAYNLFAYGTSFGIGTGLFHACLAIGLLWSLPPGRRGILAYALGLISSVAWLLVAFRANGFVQGFNVAVGYLSLFGLFLMGAVSRLEWGIWPLIWASLRFWLWSLFQWLVILSSLGKTAVTGSSGISAGVASVKRTLSFLKTAVLTIILMFVFAAILSSADPIFSRIVDRALSESLGRVFQSLFIASFIAMLLSIALPQGDDREPKIGFLTVQDIVVSVTGLLILFGVFLVVQFRYLFASHEVFQTFGLTYSQYVRKGFFELLMATALGLGISYVIILKRRSTDAYRSLLLAVNLGLFTELLLLLVSAYRRDLMYIDVFGLTRTRIIGEVFLYWLTGVLLLFCIHAVSEKFREQFVLAGVGLLSLGALVYLNSVNMDMRIVNHVPIRNEKKDLFYIANLSEDAAGGWKDVVAEARGRFAQIKEHAPSDDEATDLASLKLALVTLRAKRMRLERKYAPLPLVRQKYVEVLPAISAERKSLEKRLVRDRKWQSANLSEYRAWNEMLGEGSFFFDDLDYLYLDVRRYQVARQVDLYQKELWILRDFRYPFVDTVNYWPNPKDVESSQDIQQEIENRSHNPSPATSYHPGI